MNRNTHKMKDLAERLIAHETKGNKSSETKGPVAFQVCEKLRPNLTPLMGNAGFRALLSRALALASKEVSRLQTVQVNREGFLAGWDEAQTQGNPVGYSEGGVVLLARLLELLVTFIGEDLTLRLLREGWPNLALNDLGFNKGGKNEKTK